MAAELSDVAANTQTPIGAIDDVVSPSQGVTNEQEMGGLLPPSHWTQLAEVGGSYKQGGILTSATPALS